MIFIYEKSSAMKKLIFFFATLLSFVASAQVNNIADSESSTNIDIFNIDCTWADVEIKEWSGNEVKVEGRASINNGLNDDAFEYAFEKRGSTLQFEADIPNMDELPRFATYEQGGQQIQRLLGKDEKWNNYDLWKKEGVKSMSIGPIIEVELTFFVPKSIALKINQVHGDVVMNGIANDMDVNTTHGHVEAIFSNKLPQNCKISSTHNFVDVSVSRQENIDLVLRTHHGEIYTDLSMDQDRSRSTHEMYNSKIVASVNKGGATEMKLSATHGNIYLRGK